MQILLLSSLFMLVLNILVSTDLFLKNTTLLIVSFCAVCLNIITNSYLFTYLLYILFVLINLFFVKIKFMDILTFFIISTTILFWLSIKEFVDGFAYSYIYICIFITLTSFLLFEYKYVQFWCVTAMIFTLFIAKSLMYVVDDYLYFESVIVCYCIGQSYYNSKQKHDFIPLNNRP